MCDSWINSYVWHASIQMCVMTQLAKATMRASALRMTQIRPMCHITPFKCVTMVGGWNAELKKKTLQFTCHVARCNSYVWPNLFGGRLKHRAGKKVWYSQVMWHDFIHRYDVTRMVGGWNIELARNFAIHMSHEIIGLFCRICPLLQGSCAKETCSFIDCKKLCNSHVTQLCPVTPYALTCVTYGVATVSRIDKIIGPFCRIYSRLQGSCAKETYGFIDCKKLCDLHVTQYVSIRGWGDWHGKRLKRRAGMGWRRLVGSLKL